MRINYLTGPCAGCQQTRLLVFKQENLCQYCNMDRLQRRALNQKHSRGADTPEKAVLKPAKRRSPLKAVSGKQRDKNALLHEVYDLMAGAGAEARCTGCGTTRRLSHSHIIARSRRPDLIQDPANISYQCLSWGAETGCHDVWEHGSYAAKCRLRDFGVRLDYIRTADPEYFHLLLLKWGVSEHELPR